MNTIVCDVTDVTFTCGSIEVAYTLSLLLPPTVNSDDVIQEVLSALVEAADNGTLLANTTIDTTSFAIGQLGTYSRRHVICHQAAGYVQWSAHHLPPGSWIYQMLHSMKVECNCAWTLCKKTCMFVSCSERVDISRMKLPFTSVA